MHTTFQITSPEWTASAENIRRPTSSSPQSFDPVSVVVVVFTNIIYQQYYLLIESATTG